METLTEARWAALKAYCRIDELTPDEDTLLASLYHSAISYMKQAGVSEPEADSPRRAQYDLCVSAMVLDAWDNRGTASGGTIYDNPAFRRRLSQLKFTEPIVSESDT